MEYKIEVLLKPNVINKRLLYYWCIIGIDEHNSSNCGFGWSSSITNAFNDAYNYYSNYLKQ